MTLEPLGARHARAHLRPLSDRRLYRFIPFDPPESLAALTRRYRRLARRRSADGGEAWLNWAMRLDGKAHVGVMQATVLPGRSALMAYMVFVPHQRRGLAAEGCRAVLDHLFATRRRAKVSCFVDARNRASRALMRSLGFKRAACIRNADVFKGAVSREYRYDMTRARWTSSTTKP